MSNSLPSRPSLEHLKKQAKDLLAAHENGDHNAIRRVRAAFPLPAPFTLVQAQLVIAREYGFESWAKLKNHLESTRASRIEKSHAIARHLVTGDADAAFEILEEDPSLASESFASACALGQVESVREYLDRDRVDVGARLAPNGWAPLCYVCFSRALGYEPFRPGMLATAELLLERGADPNSYWLTPDSQEDEPCLYGATGVNNSPELTEILLKAGANPNDRESLYHAAELPDPACYELLLKYGGRPSRVFNAFARLLDFERPDWLRLVLRYEKGPDLPPVISHAMRRGRSAGMIQLLVDSGMDLNAPDLGGFRPYQAAIRLGREDVAETLRKASANTETTEADRAIGRLARGEDVADLAMETIETLNRERSPVLVMWTERGHIRAVRRLLELGADPNCRDENGSTPLHQAAWHANADGVRLLLKHGADPSLCDAVHQGTPLGWACWAAEFAAGGPDSRFEVVQILLDHGSPIPDILRGGPKTVALLQQRKGASNAK